VQGGHPEWCLLRELRTRALRDHSLRLLQVPLRVCHEGQRGFLVRGKHDKESEEESHLSTGCVAGVKHTWRIRKAEYEYHQHHHGHRQSKGDKKGAALLRDCLAENFSGLILSY